MTARAFACDVPAFKVSARRRRSYRGSSALRRTGSGSGTPAGSELAFGSPPAGAPSPSRQPIWTIGLTTTHTSGRGAATEHQRKRDRRQRWEPSDRPSQPHRVTEETESALRTCGGSLLRGTAKRPAPSAANRPGIPLGKRPRGYHGCYVRGSFYGPDPIGGAS